MNSIWTKLLADGSCSSLSLGDREHSLITNQPGESFVAVVLGKRLITLDVL